MYVQVLRTSNVSRFEDLRTVSNEIVAVARDSPGFIACKVAGFLPVGGLLVVVNYWRDASDADIFLTERLSALSEKHGWQFRRLDDYIPAYEVIASS
jgi:hypothetical protein